MLLFEDLLSLWAGQKVKILLPPLPMQTYQSMLFQAIGYKFIDLNQTVASRVSCFFRYSLSYSVCCSYTEAVLPAESAHQKHVKPYMNAINCCAMIFTMTMRYPRQSFNISVIPVINHLYMEPELLKMSTKSTTLAFRSSLIHFSFVGVGPPRLVTPKGSNSKGGKLDQT